MECFTFLSSILLHLNTLLIFHLLKQASTRCSAHLLYLKLTFFYQLLLFWSILNHTAATSKECDWIYVTSQQGHGWRSGPWSLWILVLFISVIIFLMLQLVAGVHSIASRYCYDLWVTRKGITWLWLLWFVLFYGKRERGVQVAIIYSNLQSISHRGV